MKKIATLLTIAALAIVLSCEEEPGPGPAAPQIPPPAEALVDLLPGSTRAAVRLLDLAGRWDELRAIPPLARLQDHLLNEVQLDPADVPEIAGRQAVIAMVADEATRRIVPVAILDPPSPAEALQRLAESDGLFASAARGVIWTGPASHARLVEHIAAGDGTSLHQAVDFSALDNRLPPGGLVRAALNPRALSDGLRRWAEFEGTGPAGSLARLLAVELEAVDVVGFRRDFVDGELVTDIWVGIDSEVVPEALTRALAAHRGPAVLPSPLPADVLVANSFRTEPEAGLAWLRTLAARDPRGPLRNLEFWIDEFETRSGRSVESDIVSALGERGLVLLIESEDDNALELVAILDAHDAGRLEAALIDLRDWLAEQIWGRTLGLAVPQHRDADDASGGVHKLDFWSPFGSLLGPAFQIVDDHLVVATSRSGLDRGVELARAASTWATPDWALGDGPADEIALIRTSTLARVLADRWAHSAGHGPPLGAIAEFLAGAGEGRVRVDYDEQGFRITATLRIDAAGSASE